MKNQIDHVIKMNDGLMASKLIFLTGKAYQEMFEKLEK